jgi:hypothetical protein
MLSFNGKEVSSMRLPRMTTRQMMIWTLVVGLGLWTGSACYRELTEPSRSWLYHMTKGRLNTLTVDQHPAPFWPRYWRRLLGRPWPDTYVCPDGCKMGRYAGRYVRTVAVPPPELHPGMRVKDQPIEFVRRTADELSEQIGLKK